MRQAIHSIITAAGDSTDLFHRAGFDKPKNLLLWDGSEVVVHAVNSYSQSISRTTVVLNENECDNWPTVSLLNSKFPGIQIKQVSAKVQGSLVSALLAADSIPDDAPLVIASGDSKIEGGVGLIIDEFLDQEVDAGTVVFASNSSRWSYVLPGPEMSVRQVAEKQVIGPLATTGVFFFRRAEFFRRAAEWCMVTNTRHDNLFYVSMTVNYLVHEGMSVNFAEIRRDRYWKWSLPIDFLQQS